MVVNTIRRGSLESQESGGMEGSHLLRSDEKKVNISNLSDLVPEEPLDEE